MKYLLLFIALLLSFPIKAEEIEISGEIITSLLPTIIAFGENSRQSFTKTGATTYLENGRNSYGRWRVQNNLYCSHWPPSEMWVCYRVVIDGVPGKPPEKIVWIGTRGSRTINQIEQKGSSQ